MKLILVNFDNVLGLNGCINFVEGKPLFIYGENIAGKSNIINMLRYCLIPPRREKKGYVEEKRLKKNEILLAKNSNGSVEIYFEQNDALYKLQYRFQRKSGNVSQKQKFFKAEKTELPIDDDERLLTLGKLQWEDLEVSSVRALKEKLVKLKIYPEVLDILISPSNVRNFSEAINGKVVRVPEVVSAKISKIHENARRYINNLKTLHGVLTLEKEEMEKRIKELRSEFEQISKDLPEVNVKEIFMPEKTAQNLEDLQKNIAKKLESMPSEVGEMKQIVALLSSEKYEIWSESINKALTIMPKREELKSLLEKRKILDEAHETLNKWNIVFGQLPPEKSPEGVLTFSIPSYEKFDFKILSNPDRIKSIFSSAKKMKSLLQKASRICDEYQIPLRTSKINEVITKYKQLNRMLKNPVEPKGDQALICEQENKIIVSIPLDLALKKEEYLKGIEPTPFVHRPKRLDRKKFEKKILRIKNQIERKIKELRKAKSSLAEGKKLLRKVKTLQKTLTNELTILEENKKKNEKNLHKLAEKCKIAYHHLCEVFKLECEKIDLLSKENVDPSFEVIAAKCRSAQEIFSKDLIKQLKKYPEIMKEYQAFEKLTPVEIVGKVKKEFEKKIQRITELQEKYQKIGGWILTNINQLKSIEDRNKTRMILAIGLSVALEFFSKIYEKTDIERIIEQLADKIEENVKNAYSKIFPEDSSFNFEHLGKGAFLSTIKNEPITHPSGSQRAAISAGIMISLADTFRLPMILDEAFDRIDVNRLKFFVEYITGLTKAPSSHQICLAGYTSFNIEKNPEVLPFVNEWKNYLVERKKVLAKNIKPLERFSMET